MLSSGELLASQKRLENRTKEHTERQKQKLERERIVAERQRQRQEKREEEERARRLAQLAAEEQVMIISFVRWRSVVSISDSMVVQSLYVCIGNDRNADLALRNRPVSSKRRRLSEITVFIIDKSCWRSLYQKVSLQIKESSEPLTRYATAGYLLVLLLAESHSAPQAAIFRASIVRATHVHSNSNKSCTSTPAPLQILLPPSAGASLMSQNAYKNGTMFFKLSTPGGTSTHAGAPWHLLSQPARLQYKHQLYPCSP